MSATGRLVSLCALLATGCGGSSSDTGGDASSEGTSTATQDTGSSDAEASSSSSESQPGDSSSTDGDGDGDGDTTPGDGDGDTTPGDGDGDSSGDGDCAEQDDPYDDPADGCGPDEVVVNVVGVGDVCTRSCTDIKECPGPACLDADQACASVGGDPFADTDLHCLLFCSGPDVDSDLCPSGMACVPYDFFWVCTFP